MAESKMFAGIRSAILFVAGVSGIGYETIIGKTDRPVLLVVFLILCGFPLVFNLDKILQGAVSIAPTAPPSPPPDPPPPSAGPSRDGENHPGVLRRIRYRPPLPCPAFA
jgi:hypothetical protein